MKDKKVIKMVKLVFAERSTDDVSLKEIRLEVGKRLKTDLADRKALIKSVVQELLDAEGGEDDAAPAPTPSSSSAATAAPSAKSSSAAPAPTSSGAASDASTSDVGSSSNDDSDSDAASSSSDDSDSASESDSDSDSDSDDSDDSGPRGARAGCIRGLAAPPETRAE